MKYWTADEDDELLKFAVEKAKLETRVLNVEKVLQEYTESGKTTRSLTSILSRFNKYLAPNVYAMSQFDTNTKVRMMFAFGVSTNKKFLEELRERADVEVGENGKIEKYTEKREDGLKLVGYAVNALFTEEEDRQILNFLAEKARETRGSLSMNALARQFKVSESSRRSPRSIESRINKYLKPRIYLMDAFDTETKVLMLFCSDTPVDGKFLEKLRKEADVKVDDSGKITEFREKKPDGLKLTIKNYYGGNVIGKRKRATIADTSDSEGELAPPRSARKQPNRRKVSSGESTEYQPFDGYGSQFEFSASEQKAGKTKKEK
ncbi:unnamed protein product [Caenorhabditis sp. 36 PRJEB53466]|nr:unnamed protein product [Caenorhabditis sp. 36 PRJEB53466]